MGILGLFMVFAKVCGCCSRCFRKYTCKIGVVFKAKFLCYLFYAFMSISQFAFGSDDNLILYVLAEVESRCTFHSFVEVHRRQVHHACVVAWTMAVSDMLFEQVPEGNGMFYVALWQSVACLLGNDGIFYYVDNGKRYMQIQCLRAVTGERLVVGQDGKQ